MFKGLANMKWNNQRQMRLQKNERTLTIRSSKSTANVQRGMPVIPVSYSDGIVTEMLMQQLTATVEKFPACFASFDLPFGSVDPSFG